MKGGLSRRAILVGSSSLFSVALRAEEGVVVRPTGANDDAMLDDAAEKAARTRTPLRMEAGQYRRRTPWRLPLGMELDADPAAALDASDGCRIGIIVPAGNAIGRSRMPALGLYADCGLSIEGAALLDLEIPSIGGCGTGIRLTSVAKSLLDNRIRFGALFSCDVACAIRGLLPTDVIQGNVIEGNFVTTTRSTAVYEGTMCFCDGNRFAFEAVDITAEKGGGGFLLNRMKAAAVDPNPNGTSVPRATFAIREWAGGEGFAANAVGGPAQLLEGGFSDAIFDIRGTRTFLSFNSRQKTQAVVNSSIVLHMIGNHDRSYKAVGTKDLRDGAALSAFNGGEPVALDAFFVEIDTVPFKDLSVGQTADVFVYAMFTDVFNAFWVARLAGGAIDEFEIVACIDQSDREDHRLALHLRKTAPSMGASSRLQVAMSRIAR